MVKVLICGQKDWFVTVLEYRLRKFGIQLLRAETGSEALRVIHEREADIFLCPTHFPDFRFFTFLDMVRDDLHSRIPIILLVEDDNLELVANALENGADDFVIIPFRPSEIALRIEKLLQKTYQRNYEL